MKKLPQLQINTRKYWNHIYTTPARNVEYWENTYRFPFFLSHVRNGDKVIDLGCGVGIPCRMVQERRVNCETWGVDISDEIIRKNTEEEPITKWQSGRIGNLTFLPVSYFNIVFIGEVIEHLDDPSVAFAEAYRILKPGGKLVITTPLEDHIDSPEHQWEFTKEDITKLFTDAGFASVSYADLPNMEYTVVIFAVGTK